MNSDSAQQEPFREISLDVLLLDRECPMKGVIKSANNIQTKSEMAHSIIRKNLYLIIRDVLALSPKSYDFYLNRTIREAESVPDTEPSFISLTRTRAERTFASFLNHYTYSKLNVLTGGPLRVGMTEFGLSVTTNIDFIMSRNTAASIMVVADISSRSPGTIGTAMFRAAIIHEHFIRKGARCDISIHNMVSDERITYRTGVFHDNLIKSITTFLTRYGKKQLYNIGSWCSYCECANQCYSLISK